MTTRAVEHAPALERGLGIIGDYVKLTKPRVVWLLLFVTAGAMLVAAGGAPDLLVFVVTMVGGYLAAGGANAINQFVDRDIDQMMSRTTGRPVVTGRVEPARALSFGIVCGVVSFLLLGFLVNWLAASLAMVGLAVYVGVYTLWLKRTTIHNVVIGGAAGAVPPLVGWAAVTGDLALPAWLMFAIVFYWTPPHFWALSLMLRRDYASAGVPMLPVVLGEPATRRQILLWSFVMVGVSFLPVVAGTVGGLYFGIAAATGLIFIGLAAALDRWGDRWARPTFTYSLLYLAILFAAIGVDAG